MTFRAPRGRPRAGAPLAGGKLLDLQAAHRDRYGKLSQRLASVLAMAEAGEEAIELASFLSKKAGAARLAKMPR